MLTSIDSVEAVTIVRPCRNIPYTGMQVTDPGTRPSGFTAEIKFIVDAAVGAQIREWARGRLAADPHGTGTWGDQYRVSSVYFDTDARDVFYRRGSYGRSKYRIRRYQEDAVVFLERKLRNGARLAKRRTTIDMTILPLLAMPGALNGDGTGWFRRRVALRALQPVCQVAYLRTARMGSTPEGPARLTLDEGMSAFTSESFTFETRAASALLGGSMILELKYRGLVPAVFRQLVGEFQLAPRRASKYRVAAHTLGLVAAPPEEAIQLLLDGSD